MEHVVGVEQEAIVPPGLPPLEPAQDPPAYKTEEEPLGKEQAEAGTHEPVGTHEPASAAADAGKEEPIAEANV